MALPKVGGRHGNFYIAVGVGLAASAATFFLAADLFPAIAASAFSLTYLGLTVKDMRRLTPEYLRAHAADEDAPPLIVFLLTIAMVVYVMAALFMVVNDPSPNPTRLILGVTSVALSWLMIHTMWGMHYAWEYYAAPDKPTKTRKERGGLEFPGDDDPDGTDFIYFSLVVAMTDQTSDTNVTSRVMRRVVTGHSVFSYFFNTVVVAAAVNIVVQLGHS